MEFDFFIFNGLIDDITHEMIDCVPFLIIAKQLNKISANCHYGWQSAQIDISRDGFLPRINKTEPVFSWSDLYNLLV